MKKSVIRFVPKLIAAASIAVALAGCNLTEQNQAPVQSAYVSEVAASSDSRELRGLERALEAQAQTNASFLGRRGVVGTGLGQTDDGEPVVLVFVEDDEVVARLPRRVAGVPVVPEVTGKFQVLSGQGRPANNESPTSTDNGDGGSDGGASSACYVGSTTARTPRPVPLGVSAGISGFSGGTYGARLRDASGNLFMLSNNHAFAGRNNAPVGTYAIQPRPQDGGKAPNDTVGRLADFEPLLFFRAAPDGTPLEPVGLNIMDAAIVSTSAELAGNATPCDGYGIPRASALAPRKGMRVQKYGRATRLTTGNINAVNVTIDVPFGQHSNGEWTVARFTNQFLVRKPGFCDGGDSGSMLVTDAGNPVGLLFAGAATASGYCLANPIQSVLERFGMTVDGE